MSASALSLVPVRHPESAGEKLEVLPAIGVNRITRYVITHPARGWNEPKALYWGYKISECQRVCDRLPSLTPAELELVSQAVSKLLGK